MTQILVLTVCLVFLLGCGAPASKSGGTVAIPTPQPSQQPTARPTQAQAPRPTPEPSATPKPTSTVRPVATAVPTPAAQLTTSNPPSEEEARADFDAWLKNTVCSPSTASDPRPTWCDAIKQVVIVPGLQLGVHVSLGAQNRAEYEDMLHKLSAFTQNNLYKKYELSTIALVSDVDNSSAILEAGKQPIFSP